MNLYEISLELELAMNSLIDDDGMIIEGKEEELNLLYENKEKKVLSCGIFLKNQMALADMIKDEMDTLSKRKRIIDSKIEWMEKYIESCLELGDKYFNSKVELGTRKSESVKIISESTIPKKYFKTVPATKSIDKKMVKKDLKTMIISGVEIETKLNLTLK